MAEKGRRYKGAEIDVTFKGGRCIHAAECVRRLPAVFNTRRRPWVLPDAAAANEVAQIVERCPSGALQYQRPADGASERVPAVTTIAPQPDGPLYFRGHLALQSAAEAAEEAPVVETRLALCRCGASENKPFCDNSHLFIGFRDAGILAERPTRSVASDRGGLVTILPREHGPYAVRGPIDIVPVGGSPTHRADRVLLCRCGHSNSKPFCDGSHERVGFRSE